MSVMDHDTFIAKLRSKLCQSLKQKKLVTKWFERIITIEYLIARKLVEQVDYRKDTILKLCKWENQVFKGIFENNLDELASNYPTNFYDEEMITLLKTYINEKTPIEEISNFQEDFKDHERYTDLTYDNRNLQTIITKDNIGAVTQIFTPPFVAKWMVSHAMDSNSQAFLHYKVLDPCLGTGQLLLEVTDLLLAKYQLDKKINLKKTIQKIYHEQLYGFDIDESVIVFAKFLFVMKAWEKCPTYLDDEVIIPNFICLKKQPTIKQLEDVFSNIELVGSLVRVPDLDYDAILKSVQDEVKPSIITCQMLKQKYDLVITNPPYMGRKVLPDFLLQYLNQHFIYGKSELYTAFIERCLEYLAPNGKLAMLTLHTWMFIKSFSALRKHLLTAFQIKEVLHLGKNTFANLNAYNALACSFIIENKAKTTLSRFVRLTEYDDINQKEVGYQDLKNHYLIDQKQFLYLDNCPFIYWLNDHEMTILQKSPKLGSLANIRQGLATGNNKEYLRLWYEVDPSEISFHSKSLAEFFQTKKKYAPYNKGGSQTKWYKTSKTVIKFDQTSFNQLQKQGNHLPSKEYYFQEGITWSLFGFNSFNVCYKENGYVFDVSGSTMFVKKPWEKYILAYLSSNVAFFFLSAIAPTVNFQVGNLASLPVIIDEKKVVEINKIVDSLIDTSRYLDAQDELSWNYQANEIYQNYQSSLTLAKNCQIYLTKRQNLAQLIYTNEQTINQIFQEIYQINLPSATPKLIKTPTYKELVTDLLSYLVGVVFGRYPLDNYQIGINNEEFIDVALLTSKVEELIVTKMNYQALEEMEKLLQMNLKSYFTNHFGRLHIKHYHDVPIYWYKEIQHKMFIGYYHTLKKDVIIDKNQTIKENYLKNNLFYHLKR